MKPQTRRGEESAATRTAILDATVRIMLDEGYAAVSSRKVAQAAGLKSQLVYYHFGAMDELFLAVFRREEDKFVAAQARALAAKNPFRALWDLNLKASAGTLAAEFFALANHRKAIQKEIARSTERLRTLQIAFLSRFLEERGLATPELSAELLVFLVVTVSRGLVAERAVGFETGHEAVFAAAERWLAKLESASG